MRPETPPLLTSLSSHIRLKGTLLDSKSCTFKTSHASNLFLYVKEVVSENVSFHMPLWQVNVFVCWFKCVLSLGHWQTSAHQREGVRETGDVTSHRGDSRGIFAPSQAGRLHYSVTETRVVLLPQRRSESRGLLVLMW